VRLAGWVVDWGAAALCCARQILLHRQPEPRLKHREATSTSLKTMRLYFSRIQHKHWLRGVQLFRPSMRLCFDIDPKGGPNANMR
jgi:hypothetical protein